jgi:hypothetical protein
MFFIPAQFQFDAFLERDQPEDGLSTSGRECKFSYALAESFSFLKTTCIVCGSQARATLRDL